MTLFLVVDGEKFDVMTICHAPLLVCKYCVLGGVLCLMTPFFFPCFHWLHFVWYWWVYASVLMDIKQEDGGDAKDKKRSFVGVGEQSSASFGDHEKISGIFNILIDIKHRIV